VLDFAVVTHHDAGADVSASSDDAALAEYGVLANLSKVPDRRSIADLRVRRDVSGFDDPCGVQRVHICSSEYVSKRAHVDIDSTDWPIFDPIRTGARATPRYRHRRRVRPC